MVMNAAKPVSVSVSSPAHIRSASEQAREYSVRLGFSAIESEEIALAVAELASNLIKHAGGGEIQVKPMDSDNRIGIQIVSEDDGPGLPDAEKALTDGYSTAGTLGAGLGAVNRLMDQVEFSCPPAGGLRVTCRRFIRPASCLGQRQLEFGAATRSYRLLPENGDAFIIKQWEGHALAGIIDGLGHGELAQRAAQTARHYVEHHFDQSLPNLFVGVGRVCRTTRGVVMALARFDLANKKLQVASVGNVETRLLGEAPFSPVVRRGIVGVSSAPNPVPTEHPWGANSILVLHSDGIQSRWTWGDIPAAGNEKPAVIARRLLELYGRIEDDATVLVARNSRL